LLGEADFSFALAFAKFHARTPQAGPLDLTATSFESEAEVDRKFGSTNIEHLRDLGACVFHGVDATRLDRLALGGPFDDVRFNFPHALKRWRTQDNRKLLSEFFVASEAVLGRSDPHVGPGLGGKVDRAPQVVVTLARGQGGTKADRSHGLENPADSWEIEKQASSAGLVLISATPFDGPRWARRGYKSRGHRRSIKGAPTKGAIEHRFELLDPEYPSKEPYTGKKIIW